MELEIPKAADLPWPAPLGEAIPDEIMKRCLQDNTDDKVPGKNTFKLKQLY